MMASFVKILVAAAVMGVVCRGVVIASHAIVSHALPLAPWMSRLADVAVGVPAGALAFYGTAAALRVPEIGETRAAVMDKFRKAV
jgi:hypothetical protein